jgi:hypothetical protein
MGRIDLAQKRDQWRALVNTAMHLRVPYDAGEFFSNCRTGGSSRRKLPFTWVIAEVRIAK